MKKLLIILTLCVLGIGTTYAQNSPSFGDESNGRTFILKSNISDLIIAPSLTTGAVIPLSLSLEARLSKNLSLQVNGHYVLYPRHDLENTFGAGLELHWYLTKKPALEGLYLSFISDYSSPQYTYLQTGSFVQDTNSYVGVGSTLGYQWIFNKGLVLELFAGAKVNIDITNTSSYRLDYPYGLSLGWAF